MGSTIGYISRKTAYIFGIYIIYTFSIRHLPKGAEEIGTFMFLFFLNFGVQWGCYRLTHLCHTLWLERSMLGLQLVMFGWSIYAYRFAYMPALEYDKSAYLYTPLQQYAILLVLFLALLTVHGRNK